jgi:hypothetical protein
MSEYGRQRVCLDEWLASRKKELEKSWGDALYEVIRGSPWSMETNIRFDDAVDKQARAERLAHLCGQPIPSVVAALADLLEWVRQR